jgi:hypothetical protein
MLGDRKWEQGSGFRLACIETLKKLSGTELSVRVWGTESTVYFLGSLPDSQVICIVFYYKPE